MLPRTYSEQTCSIARALEVVGERWTLLILRDAFLGVRRFDDFQARLEISRTVLTRRLGDLVDVGLLRREPYQQRPLRYDYLLTERALELWPALVGLGQWGARHVTPDGVPARVRAPGVRDRRRGRRALSALRGGRAAGGGREPSRARLPVEHRAARGAPHGARPRAAAPGRRPALRYRLARSRSHPTSTGQGIRFEIRSWRAAVGTCDTAIATGPSGLGRRPSDRV